MTLDEIRGAIAELSSNIEFADKIDKIVRDNHDNSWKDELKKLTSMITKDDKFITIFIASRFKVYYFLYSLENQYEIENARVNTDNGTLNTMMKIKNYHDIKHKNIM